MAINKTTQIVLKAIAKMYELNAPFSGSILNVNDKVDQVGEQLIADGRTFDIAMPRRVKAKSQTGYSSFDRAFSAGDNTIQSKPFALNEYDKAHIKLFVDESGETNFNRGEDIIRECKTGVVAAKESKHMKVINKIGNAVLAGASADVTDLASASTRLTLAGVMNDPKIMLCSPNLMNEIVDSVSTNYHPEKELEYGFYKGKFKNVKNFMLDESVFVPTHTNGTLNSGVVSGGYTPIGTVESNFVEGAKTFVLSVADTAGLTLTAGTVLEFVGVKAVNPLTYETFATQTYQACVAETVTTDTSEELLVTLVDPIYVGTVFTSIQNVSALPVAGGVVRILGEAGASYEQAIGYVKDAFMVGYAKFHMEQKNGLVSFNGSPDLLKMKIRGIAGPYTDENTLENRYRVDSISGIAPYMSDHAVRIMRKI